MEAKLWPGETWLEGRNHFGDRLAFTEIEPPFPPGQEVFILPLPSND